MSLAFLPRLIVRTMYDLRYLGHAYAVSMPPSTTNEAPLQ